ncbi:Crp/Fnr family transcriptional regulator [Tsuneonella sp. HG249]
MSQRRHLDLRPFVRRLASRSALGQTEREAILSLPVSEEFFKANHHVLGSSWDGAHALMVSSGLVARVDINNGKTRAISALAIAGDVPNLHSIVQPMSSSDLIALAPTTVLKLPLAHLRDLADQYPGIGKALWRDCAADGSILSRWVWNLGRRDGVSRIAHLMCEMAYRSLPAEPSGEVRFKLPLTQIHLGDIIGMTSIHQPLPDETQAARIDPSPWKRLDRRLVSNRGDCRL